MLLMLGRDNRLMLMMLQRFPADADDACVPRLMMLGPDDRLMLGTGVG